MSFQDGMDEENKVNSFRLFIDENSISTFFRRPDFSPDGSLLVLPMSQYQKSRDSIAEPCILGFRRGDFSSPCCVYFTANKPVLVIKFNKNLYKSTLEPSKRLFDLDYKMIFAAGTLDSVFLFTTESTRPIISIGNIHYSPITDIAWKFDASLIGISSSDGYCSFVTFENNDLGEKLSKEEIKDEKLQNLIFAPHISHTHANGIKESIPISPKQTKMEIEMKTEMKIEGGKKKIIPMMMKSFN